nr:hypothetical protein Itr_chr05CG02810 [Ipomoea trifida]
MRSIVESKKSGVFPLNNLNFQTVSSHRKLPPDSDLDDLLTGNVSTELEGIRATAAGGGAGFCWALAGEAIPISKERV